MQMFPPVVTKDPTAVEMEVQSAYLTMFPDGDPLFVPRVFGWAPVGWVPQNPYWISDFVHALTIGSLAHEREPCAQRFAPTLHHTSAAEFLKPCVI